MDLIKINYISKIMEYNSEIKLIQEMARASQKVVLEHFQSDFNVEWKPDNTPVTIADKKAEEVIREIINRETPDYGIVGEEFGTTGFEKKRCWVIDPIDGTKSFIHGVPLFGTLIALLENGKPVLGLINLPAQNLMMTAAIGHGCDINGTACRVSDVGKIEEATVLNTSITTLERHGYKHQWETIRNKAKLHRGWGDAYGYFLVASGRAEVMVDSIAEIWDLAPMAVIIPEAGGMFSSLQGGDFIKDRSALATNFKLFQKVSKIMVKD